MPESDANETTEDRLARKRRELGEKAVAELRRRGVSEEQIEALLARKRKPKGTTRGG